LPCKAHEASSEDVLNCEASVIEDACAPVPLFQDDKVESIGDVTNQFLLKICHENELSQNVSKNIDRSVCLLISGTVKQIKRGIKRCLEDADISTDDIEGLSDVFTEVDEFCISTSNTNPILTCLKKLCEEQEILFVVIENNCKNNYVFAFT